MADEPTGALDSKSAKDLLQCMQELNEEQLVTILLVTHDAFAASFCRRILFIKDGLLYREVSRNGTRKEFYDSIINVVSELGGDSRDLY
ncbi:ABC transporter ATP-binding protein YxdL [bioreactor metagenome]|uniref:ABC transporter ATP-binding protein YxdL n=1 Tax=bioreactor metagenome TaxID=1076179 RepID=A0A645DQB0_9ZZZZ